MDRRSGVTTVAVLGGAVAAALVALAACLPDLGALPTAATRGAPDVVAVQPPTCGNGVIDKLDAGGATDEECDPGDAGDGGAVEGCSADCKITCAGGVIDPTLGHCYFPAGNAPTFLDALGRCDSAGHAHVVTFASQRETDFLAGAAVTDAGYWIGLTRFPSAGGYVTPRPTLEPGWPADGNACPGCFGLGADDAGHFADIDAGTDCVAGGGARWANRACFPSGDAGPPVVLCEREPVGQRTYNCNGPNCIDNLPATTKRYIIPTELVTADGAAAACAQLSNGTPVLLDSAEEREELVRELVTRYDLPLTVWIGLSATATGAAWDDGQTRPLPWANHEPAQPGRAYLAVVIDAFDTQLAHADGDTTTKRLVVCQRK